MVIEVLEKASQLTVILMQDFMSHEGENWLSIASPEWAALVLLIKLPC